MACLATLEECRRIFFCSMCKYLLLIVVYWLFQVYVIDNTVATSLSLV